MQRVGRQNVRRSRIRVLTRSVVFGIALAGARAVVAQEHPGHEWDHDELEHQYVRITDAGLRPETSTLAATEAVGWLNYSRMVARVSFPADVAKKMICTSDGGFRSIGERIVSPDIQATQFASLCRLQPGTYPYEVTLAPGIGSSSRPPRTFEGRLLVR